MRSLWLCLLACGCGVQPQQGALRPKPVENLSRIPPPLQARLCLCHNYSGVGALRVAGDVGVNGSVLCTGPVDVAGSLGAAGPLGVRSAAEMQV
ncbi:MAG: hypothetical protein EOO40_11100, partial [Deltaproteobacteria bacterium]